MFSPASGEATTVLAEAGFARIDQGAAAGTVAARYHEAIEETTEMPTTEAFWTQMGAHNQATLSVQMAETVAAVVPICLVLAKLMPEQPRS